VATEDGAALPSEFSWKVLGLLFRHECFLQASRKFAEFNADVQGINTSAA